MPEAIADSDKVSRPNAVMIFFAFTLFLQVFYTSRICFCSKRAQFQRGGAHILLPILLVYRSAIWRPRLSSNSPGVPRPRSRDLVIFWSTAGELKNPPKVSCVDCSTAGSGKPF